MGSFIFICALFFFLFYWDVNLRVRSIINRAAARRFADRKVHRMTQLVFAVTDTYLNHKIYFSTAVSEQELPDHFILIANHQSLVDIPILVYCFPNRKLRFVAKGRFFHGAPLISQLLRVQKHAAIYDGGRVDATNEELARIARMSRRGVYPVVFPEGTRSRTGALAPFRSGAFRRIIEAQKNPVVVVAIDGGWIMAEARQLASKVKNCVYRVKIVGVHEAPDSRADSDLLMKRAYDQIERQLRLWRKIDAEGIEPRETKKRPPTKSGSPLHTN